MTRAVLVGVAAALLLLLLLSVSTYIELRYTRLAGFMSDTAVEMRNQHVSRAYIARYGDPIDFMGKWLRINQLLIDPALCIVVGVFVGLLTRRALVAAVIGTTPFVVFYWLRDLLSILSICICLAVSVSVAVGTRHTLKRGAATAGR